MRGRRQNSRKSCQESHLNASPDSKITSRFLRLQRLEIHSAASVGVRMKSYDRLALVRLRACRGAVRFFNAPCPPQGTVLRRALHQKSTVSPLPLSRLVMPPPKGGDTCCLCPGSVTEKLRRLAHFSPYPPVGLARPERIYRHFFPGVPFCLLRVLPSRIVGLYSLN